MLVRLNIGYFLRHGNSYDLDIVADEYVTKRIPQLPFF
jgi:hypothetical protein